MMMITLNDYVIINNIKKKSHIYMSDKERLIAFKNRIK